MKRPVLADKDYMRAEEASALCRLSRRKLARLLKEGGHDFVALYGRRKLIIRQRFEEYLARPGVREALTKKWEKER